MSETPENQSWRELTDVLEEMQSELGYLMDDGLNDPHDGDDAFERLDHWMLEAKELWGRVKSEMGPD